MINTLYKFFRLIKEVSEFRFKGLIEIDKKMLRHSYYMYPILYEHISVISQDKFLSLLS